MTCNSSAPVIESHTNVGFHRKVLFHVFIWPKKYCIVQFHFETMETCSFEKLLFSIFYKKLNEVSNEKIKWQKKYPSVDVILSPRAK